MQRGEVLFKVLVMQALLLIIRILTVGYHQTKVLKFLDEAEGFLINLRIELKEGN